MEDRSGGALGFVHLPDVRLAAERAWIPVEEAVLERGGGKADGARRLAELACRDGAGFKTPPALVVPFGVMEAALHASPDIEGEYRGLIERLGGRGADAEGRRLREEKGSGRDWDSASLRRGLQGADQLRALIQQVRVPEEIGSGVADKFGREARFMVRSSSNCEDLPELAGAGLYESVANVPLSGIASAVREVWSSLWTRRAGLSRQQAGIPHEQAHMAVLIQPMLAPDLSFVLHTVNPPDCNPGEVYAEAAVGLGETLVSGAVRGTPYRLVCDKSSGAVRTLAFASFSHALRPAAEGVARETIDYTRVPLSRDGEARRNLGRRLCAIGCFVEAAFQRPQDIEGVVVGEEIYLVQARPQQGVEKAGKRRTIN